MPPVTPKIEELTKSYMNGLVQEFNRANRRYSLEALFPSQTREGTRWNVDVVTAGRGRGLVKQLGAATKLIGPDAWRQLSISPFHHGQRMEIYDEEMSVLRRPGSEQKLRRGQIVGDKLMKLTHQWRALRQHMCAQCLSAGSLTFAENGVNQTVDYSIATLTNPSTSWANAAATIPEDIQGWHTEFFEACGVPPRYALFNPTKVREYFLGNTDLQGWLGKMNRGTVEAYFKSLMDVNFVPDDLFGLIWIPIIDTYETTDGDRTSQAYSWSQDVITLMAEPEPGDEILRFLQAETEQTDGTGGPVADTYMPDEPKGKVFVRLHANGIPAVMQDYRVMRVADLTP